MNRIPAIAALAVVLLSACDQPLGPDGSPSHRHPRASYVAVPGDAIAFQYCGRNGDGEGYFTTWCNMYVYNSDGTMSIAGSVAVNPDILPPFQSKQSWSPDGSRIAYAGYNSIVTVAADGSGNEVTLTSTEAYHGSPAWSPSGERIAFASERDGPLELYLMNADGSDVTRLTNGAGVAGAGNPTWSPDGGRIAFDCVVDAGNSDICVINADGTGLVRLTSDPTAETQADFSPDGTRIALTYGQKIAVMDADGRNITAITEGAQPEWSPAGNRLVFVRVSESGGGACDAGGYSWCDPHTVSDFYVINADGTGEGYVSGGSGPTWKPGASVSTSAPPVAEFTSYCRDLDCWFSSTSTDDHQVVSYLWSFGNGETSTSFLNAGVNYAATGTYDVTLVVRDFEGQSSTVTHTVSVIKPEPDDPPVAVFTISCSGMTCTFDSSASTDDKGIVSRDWGWGDGVGPWSGDVVATHTYSHESSFLVRLTVTDARNQRTSAYQYVTVGNKPPVPAFTSSCTALDCTFNSGWSTDDRGIASRSWDFGDGTSGSNTVIATHHYGTPGTYSVTLWVYDTDRMGVPVSHDVIVVAPPADLPPVAQFTASCSDLTCSFESSGSSDDFGIASRAWSFGDGSAGSTITSPSHAYTAGGAYVVTLTVTDTKGQTNTVTQSVTATPPDLPPVARFTASCSLLTCSFQSSSSSDDIGIVSRAWTFGDGTAAGNVVAPSHTYGAGGAFDVTLTVTDAKGQSNSTTQSVTAVDQPPVASFTVSCSLLTCYFDSGASTDDIGIASRAWTFGDGTSAGNVAAPSHSYASAGTYAVTLSVTDTRGQTRSVTKSLVATAPDLAPIARFTVTCSGLVCSFQSDASTDDVGIASRRWDYGDGSYGGDVVAPTHTYPAGLRTYSATLFVTDTKGQVTSVTHAVPAVDQPPVARFTYTCAAATRGQTTCTFDGRSSTDDARIMTYSWTYGAAGPVNSEVLVASFKSKSTQVITLTVTDGAGQTSSVTKTITAN